MKVAVALITIFCLRLAHLQETDPIAECKHELTYALYDMQMPHDVADLVTKIRAAQLNKSVSLVTAQDVAGKFELPSGCTGYVQAIDDLMKFDSCNRVNVDKKLSDRFWSSIPKFSVLDNFLGGMKACVHLIDAEAAT